MHCKLNTTIHPMAGTLELPVVSLSSSDRAASARTIRKVCLDHGFFYLTEHGIEKELLDRVFVESGKFYALPMEERMKLKLNKAFRGYNPINGETTVPNARQKEDLTEGFNIGPGANSDSVVDVNEWPSEETLPYWRETMETYYEKIQDVSKNLCSLIALSLNLDSQFFEKIGAFNPAMGMLRLIHYPGGMDAGDNGKYRQSAHTDYSMITLLLTDGVPGLQMCRESDKEPQLWEDVPHLDGAFVVNVGDLLERWTNCVFRSTLHRVLTLGQERYSVAFFVQPNFDCIVECLDSCCSEESPARFPPISTGDYIKARMRAHTTVQNKEVLNTS